MAITLITIFTIITQRFFGLIAINFLKFLPIFFEGGGENQLWLCEGRKKGCKGP